MSYHQISLRHWGRHKMGASSPTIFSNTLSWMKMFRFRLKSQWNWTAASYYLNQRWLVYRRIYAPSGLNELNGTPRRMGLEMSDYFESCQASCSCIAKEPLKLQGDAAISSPNLAASILPKRCKTPCNLKNRGIHVGIIYRICIAYMPIWYGLKGWW